MKKQPAPREYDLAWTSIAIIIVAVVVIMLIVQLQDILLLLLTAMLLVAAMEPYVARLARHVPRVLAALVVVIVLFLIPVGVVVAIAPVVLSQVPTFLQSLGTALASTSVLRGATINLSALVQPGAQLALLALAKINDVIWISVALLVLTYSALVHLEQLEKIVFSVVPPAAVDEARTLIHNLARISGGYIRGNLLISLICTVAIFTGLVLLGVPFPAQIAILAGIADLLPMVGAVSLAIPAGLLVLQHSTFIAVLTVLYFVVYQQVENHTLVPLIYNKALSLHPVFVVLAALIGATLFGIPGAFLALPVAASVPALIRFFDRHEVIANISRL